MWKLKIAEDGPWLRSVNNHVGRQHWEFDPDAGTPEERAEVERLRHEFKKNRFKIKQSADLLMRMQLRKENAGKINNFPEAVKMEEAGSVSEGAVTTTLRRATTYLSSIQAHDGHWPSEIAGPLFFLPPLVMALHITGGINTVLSAEHQKEIKRYMYNHQNEDGGWGLHVEGNSTVFGSTLNYIALRLLGEGPDDGEDNAMTRGRRWILDHGGAVGIPSWGKFWLTVLGVYEWDGCNPMPPEFWLVPKISPIHPGMRPLSQSTCMALYACSFPKNETTHDFEPAISFKMNATTHAVSLKSIQSTKYSLGKKFNPLDPNVRTFKITRIFRLKLPGYPFIFSFLEVLLLQTLSMSMTFIPKHQLPYHQASSNPRCYSEDEQIHDQKGDLLSKSSSVPKISP